MYVHEHEYEYVYVHEHEYEYEYVYEYVYVHEHEYEYEYVCVEQTEGCKRAWLVTFSCTVLCCVVSTERLVALLLL